MKRSFVFERTETKQNVLDGGWGVRFEIEALDLISSRLCSYCVVFYYFGCLAPPNNKALNLQQHLCQGPRKNTPGPRTKNFDGPQAHQNFWARPRGVFARGALAKMLLQLERVVVGWSQAAKVIKNTPKYYVFERFLVPSGFGPARSGGRYF